MILKGNISGNGRITPLEIMYIVAYNGGYVILDERQKIAADVNNDGRINAGDIAGIIIHFGGGLIDEVVLEEGETREDFIWKNFF